MKFPTLKSHRAVVSAVCAALFCFAATVFAADAQAPHSRHVVVVVMDGLRADSVTERDMPTLFALSRQGTLFAAHHPVYPSSTEVNGVALATGGYPVHDGIMFNKEYRPDIELLRPIETESHDVVRKGDEVSGGKYLGLPTVAEILRLNHRTTAVAGTKGVALLWDRGDRANTAGQKTAIDLYQGKTVPASAIDSVSPDHQSIPPVADAKKSPNAAADRWTTRALTERLWADGVPDFSVLWLSEPDYAQHGSGPGSAVAREALRSSDDNLAVILQSLDKAGVRDATDVMVVSDHGFSTIRRNFDLAEVLRGAGFDAATEFKHAPSAGQVMVVGSGGAACLYVIDRDKAIVARLVDFLQTSDFAGVVFTREQMPGTFALKQVGIDTASAPDVVVSMRWTDQLSGTGMPGLIESDGVKRVPGQGNHASLSRFDMHNTLIAAGPDFKAGFIDTLPTGNSDVAPTVLRLLGVKSDSPADGRVLSEALRDEKTATEKSETETLEATRNLANGTTWRQYLKVSKLGRQTYYDEGNGQQVPVK